MAPCCIRQRVATFVGYSLTYLLSKRGVDCRWYSFDSQQQQHLWSIIPLELIPNQFPPHYAESSARKQRLTVRRSLWSEAAYLVDHRKVSVVD